MAQNLTLDVVVIHGFRNGSDHDVAFALRRATENYTKTCTAYGITIVGKVHALPQPRLDNPAKLDVIVRAAVKAPTPKKKKKRKSPTPHPDQLRLLAE